jgi:hypothetical protein
LPVGQFSVVWQNGATGISEITPLTGHAADMPKSTRMTHVGHKDRAKGSLSGQFQVNSYPCSKQLGAWSYAGVCTHAPTSGGRVIGVDGVSDFNALHSGKHNEKVQLCAFDVLALDGDDYLDALPRLRPLPDRSRGPD